MTTSYARHLTQTPQSQPLPGQIPNSAGGHAWAVDRWTRFERFLLLGSEGGSFYVGEQKLTVENARAVQECIAEDGLRAVRRIVEVSEAGRAPKNDPAVFALALAASFLPNKADPHIGSGVRSAALEALPRVCRIPTHLFQFIEAVEAFRGHGRALNRALREWYTSRDARSLAYAVSKYQSRGGWAHRDVLRLCRPKASGLVNDVLHWAVKGWPGVGDEPHPEEALLPIWAFERAKRATSEAEVVRLIRDYRLVRECVPTQFLNSPAVWEALLQEMPLTALVRNLGKMTSLNLLTPGSDCTRKVTDALGSQDALRRSRVHPMTLLVAQKVYEQGRGDKGGLTWQPCGKVADALDAAFYLAFGNVEPTGKWRLCAIDASGSMTAAVAGCGSLTCRQAAVAMSLVTVATEPNAEVLAFTSNGHAVALPVTARQRLTDAIHTLERHLQPAGTDCALPFLWAANNKRQFDAVELYTDSESWAGHTHAAPALNAYRRHVNVPTRLAVVSMVANAYTVGDPNDALTLQVAGFDTSVPHVLAEFIRGNPPAA